MPSLKAGSAPSFWQITTSKGAICFKNTLPKMINWFNPEKAEVPPCKLKKTQLWKKKAYRVTNRLSQRSTRPPRKLCLLRPTALWELLSKIKKILQMLQGARSRAVMPKSAPKWVISARQRSQQLANHLVKVIAEWVAPQSSNDINTIWRMLSLSKWETRLSTLRLA